MTALPRGRCTACGADVALRKGGLVREHRPAGGGAVCLGSGSPAAPSEAKQAADDLLTVSLEVAVPLWIEEVRNWTEEARIERARKQAQVIAEHGDDLLFGGKDAANAFNALALGLACLAFQPGGVTFAGSRWEATCS